MAVLVADQRVEEAGGQRVLASLALNRRSLHRSAFELEGERAFLPGVGILLRWPGRAIDRDRHQAVVGVAEVLRQLPRRALADRRRVQRVPVVAGDARNDALVWLV